VEAAVVVAGFDWLAALRPATRKRARTQRDDVAVDVSASDEGDEGLLSTSLFAPDAAHTHASLARKVVEDVLSAGVGRAPTPSAIRSALSAVVPHHSRAHLLSALPTTVFPAWKHACDAVLAAMKSVATGSGGATLASVTALKARAIDTVVDDLRRFVTGAVGLRAAGGSGATAAGTVATPGSSSHLSSSHSGSSPSPAGWSAADDGGGGAARAAGKRARKPSSAAAAAAADAAALARMAPAGLTGGGGGGGGGASSSPAPRQRGRPPLFDADMRREFVDLCAAAGATVHTVTNAVARDIAQGLLARKVRRGARRGREGRGGWRRRALPPSCPD
jgi:hypothetical protein